MPLPEGVIIKGVALNDFGLSAYDLSDDNTSDQTIQIQGIDGIALVTAGFLVSQDAFWYVCEEDITTTWSDCT